MEYFKEYYQDRSGMISVYVHIIKMAYHNYCFLQKNGHGAIVTLSTVILTPICFLRGIHVHVL